MFKQSRQTQFVPHAILLHLPCPLSRLSKKKTFQFSKNKVFIFRSFAVRKQIRDPKINEPDKNLAESSSGVGDFITSRKAKPIVIIC